jgi:hypothetical protein
VLDRLRRAGKLDYLDDDLRARYAASGFVGLPIL